LTILGPTFEPFEYFRSGNCSITTQKIFDFETPCVVNRSKEVTKFRRRGEILILLGSHHHFDAERRIELVDHFMDEALRGRCSSGNTYGSRQVIGEFTGTIHSQNFGAA
jgi:hypothetical protein